MSVDDQTTGPGATSVLELSDLVFVESRFADQVFGGSRFQIEAAEQANQQGKFLSIGGDPLQTAKAVNVAGEPHEGERAGFPPCGA